MSGYTMQDAVREIREIEEAGREARRLQEQHEVKATKWAKKILGVFTSMQVFKMDKEDVTSALEDIVREIMTEGY